MIYCYDKRHPLESFKYEIASAMKNNQVVFYDDELEEFTDIEGNIVDISNQVLMCRTWAGHIDELNEVILEFGGIPAISDEDTKKITEWPNYYKPKRKTIILTGEELMNPEIIAELEKNFGKEIFIKTASKNFNSIIPISLLKDEESVFYRTLKYHLSDQFIISEKVDVLKDKNGQREYRCFVINNEIANISRMTDEVFHKIDAEVLKRLTSIVNQVAHILPAFYVVDVFEYTSHGHQEIDVVEFNPFQASGCYLYNSAIEVRSDLLHDRLESVPREKMHTLDHTSYTGKMIERRESLYDVPFSFANNLRSIFLTGNIGTFFTDAKISKEDFASHGSFLKNRVLTPITDDSCLSDSSLIPSFSPVESDDDLKSEQELPKTSEIKKLTYVNKKNS